MTRVLFALIGLVLLLTQTRAPVITKRESDLRPVLLRPGVVSLLARSQRPLLIDLLWLRSLNAVGEMDSARKNRALYEYSVFLTDLDPRFYHAYLYLALNVPSRQSREWVNGELADDLYRRGLVQFPGDLRLLMARASNAFLVQRDFVRASDLFAEAGRVPGAPQHLIPLSVRLRAERDPRGALEYARSLLNDTAEDDVLRADLEKKLKLLEIEDELQVVDKAIEEYQRLIGVLPQSLDQLRFRGLYLGPDYDSLGGLISIGPNGRAASSASDERMKLYVDPNDPSN